MNLSDDALPYRVNVLSAAVKAALSWPDPLRGPSAPTYSGVHMSRILVGSLALLLLGACAGGSGQGIDDEQVDNDAVAAALEQCVDDAGYAPEVLASQPVGDIPSDSIYADPEFRAVLERCIVSSGAGEVEGDTPEEVADQNRRATVLTDCMRDRGWEVPDPTMVAGPAGSEYLVPTITGPPTDDAETEAAFADDFSACADEAGIPLVIDSEPEP